MGLVHNAMPSPGDKEPSVDFKEGSFPLVAFENLDQAEAFEHSHAL